jgi:hypothetical protein
LLRVVVAGARVDIETTVRTYLLDISKVEPAESTAARKVLKKMHAHGGFRLEFE